MKKLTVSAFLLVSFFSANTFAMHAYRSMNCTSESLNFNYLGNYPMGGDYSITKKSEESKANALPLVSESDERHNTLEDAGILFNVVSSEDLGEKIEDKDCGFDHTEWTSKKVVEISLISSEATSELGLVAGQKILFTCNESTDYPNGISCDE